MNRQMNMANRKITEETVHDQSLGESSLCWLDEWAQNEVLTKLSKLGLQLLYNNFLRIQNIQLSCLRV